jgi:DnaK suppressor protein
MTNEAPALDYRALLEAERASLVHELEELGAPVDGSGAGLSYDSNFADSSQVTAERGETETLVTELRSAFDDVQRALERVGLGTYGVCERCGRPITSARLEAKPAVTTCIDCASATR